MTGLTTVFSVETKMSKYIVFEGIDGSGKSTMSWHAYEYLCQKLGPDKVIHTRHPGSTPLGQEIRKLIKHGDVEIDRTTEQMLMTCDHSAFVQTILKPALDEGKIVIADRSNIISGLVYGSAGGADIDMWMNIADIVPTPPIDGLFVYKCPWQVAKERIINDPSREKCRIEERGNKFFETVTRCYDDVMGLPTDLVVAARIQRVTVIDATKSMDEVKELTIAYLRILLDL